MKDKNIFMKIAILFATQSTCQRHKVGAVITKDNKMISTGYNGVASGCVHCEDHTFTKPGEHHEWSNVNEIHAEVNAILQADKTKLKGATLYCTLAPCNNCCKLIIASGIETVIYHEEYNKAAERKGLDMLIDNNIEIIHLKRV